MESLINSRQKKVSQIKIKYFFLLARNYRLLWWMYLFLMHNSSVQGLILLKAILKSYSKRVMIFNFNVSQSWKFLYCSLELQSTQRISHVIQELQFYYKEHCIDLQPLITNSILLILMLRIAFYSESWNLCGSIFGHQIKLRSVDKHDRNELMIF